MPSWVSFGQCLPLVACPVCVVEYQPAAVRTLGLTSPSLPILIILVNDYWANAVGNLGGQSMRTKALVYPQTVMASNAVKVSLSGTVGWITGGSVNVEPAGEGT